MSRPLRIEYPDPWYHVMNRGRRAEDIFSDAQDYEILTELLKETSEIEKGARADLTPFLGQRWEAARAP